MKFTISTGNSRKDKFWKQQTVAWDEFVKKLSRTTVTSETQAEYRKMKKHEQDNIKDVGGFVAGELKDGRRRKENVLSRSMLTLDMDYAEDAEALTSNIEMLYGYACCFYSTHKHTPEKPRLRVIIPLSRLVSADEYQAISRMIAKEVGMELFDDTTYEPNRLMYWPSTSSDGEYFFKVIEGEYLVPDEVLALYKNWQDTSSWPVSSRQTAIISKLMKKHAYPMEKDGMVGAFCRSYGVTEAIEKFLAEVYIPSVMPERYDFIPADSTAGVVIYDNKYAYSHHATDPACGKLSNAFDLVRVHLFGELDEDVDEKKQLPSYKAMLEFCTNDEEVKRQLAKEREEDVRAEFDASHNEPESEEKKESESDDTSDVNQNTEDEDLGWQLSLDLNKNGTVKDTPTNLLTIMRNDSRLKGVAYERREKAEFYQKELSDFLKACAAIEPVSFRGFHHMDVRIKPGESLYSTTKNAKDETYINEDGPEQFRVCTER